MLAIDSLTRKLCDECILNAKRKQRGEYFCRHAGIKMVYVPILGCQNMVLHRLHEMRRSRPVCALRSGLCLAYIFALNNWTYRPDQIV